MNFDSLCNLMEDKQLLRNQLKEPCNTEGRDYARTCSTCNSNLTSSRVLPPPSYHSSVYIYNSSDWEICEELRLRELEEAKARTAQMEKTMRWWSDCTANWREKWSKVRAERNKAREEGRQLKLKLEASMKDLSAVKKINQCLLTENKQVEARNIRKNNFPFSEMCSMTGDHLGSLEEQPAKHTQNKISKVESGSQDIYATELGDHQDSKITLEILGSGGKCTSVFLENPNTNNNPTQFQEDEVVHISVLHLHLHESRKILQKEQKIRSSLEKEIEKLKSEKTLWKWKYEELRKSKQQSRKQFGIHNDAHQAEVEKNMEDLQEDKGAKSQNIWGLQSEMERLQSESASERERRKILDTEKQELDIENRRLKIKMKDLQDTLDRKSKLSAILSCRDLKLPHSDLLGKNKDLMDLQYSDGELYKQDQDILAELMHTRKRVEQHKAEAKELSIRVEDLRRKLKQAESKKPSEARKDSNSTHNPSSP
ncbi:coiled-coil domain-containing protein 102B isoform X1 [Rhineura floridana]|uniref:coiled-coil domain-containing protein 102B isoform X1 n=1 Tax=Rhineura floridana TaxID=261503 RepID=UPI002AC80397|nr:coiled-coil domain-containing protein 102B isoform X1 [Rhineura floridana]